MKVKESKTYYDLVINLDDIGRLENVFEQAFERDKLKLAESNDVKSRSPFLEVAKSISFWEDFNVSFEYDSTSSSSQMVSDLSDMHVRKCKWIMMAFWSPIDDKRASVSIVSGSRFSIECSADDRQFVSGFLRSVADVVTGIKPQNSSLQRFIQIFDIPLLVILAGLIDYFWFSKIIPDFWSFIFSFFVPPKSEINNIGTNQLALIFLRHPNVVYFGYQVWNISLSFCLAFCVLKLIKIELNQMYPKIEFSFGPEHMREELRSRRTLYGILSVVVLPLVLDLIYDVLKLLITSSLHPPP